MLEIFGIILLCNKNKANALARGRKPGGFVALTVCLWVGLEIAGAIIGGAAELGLATYLIAIAMAALGGLISSIAAKNCKPGSYVPPAPKATEPPQETEQEKAAFCHKCGAPLREGAEFCAGCGARRLEPFGVQTAQAPIISTDEAAVPIRNASASESSGGNAFSKFAVIFNLCAGCFFTVFPFFFLLEGDTFEASMLISIIPGMLIAGYSILCLALMKRRYPKGLRILSTVLFVLAAVIFTIVAIIGMSEL